MPYANGQIPAAALTTISGRAGARLLAGPAASWERVFTEVRRRFGWSPTPTGPSDAYRELAVQVSTFLDRYLPARTGAGVYGDVRWWNGVRYVRKAGKAAAAVPGTSNHGKGRAVDVTGLGGFAGQRYAEFAQVAVPLGWSNAEGRSVDEPWHWVDLLSPETVSSGHALIPGVTPVPNLTAPTVLEEDFMSALTYDEQRELYGNTGFAKALAEQAKNAAAATLALVQTHLAQTHANSDIANAALQNVTNGIVALLGRSAGDVDERELAAALAPLLASPTLSDADLARVAKAVNDEQARRLAS
jgi:hypothetical protein